MTDPAKTAATPRTLSLWTGMRIHLVLWVGVALVAVLTSRGILLPGQAWAVPVAVLALALVAILVWVPSLGRVARLALHTCSMGLALWAVLEIALTQQQSDVVSLERYPYPYRTHGVIPNLTADTNRLEMTSNDTGLRDFETVGPKPAGELRILVIGGSAVLGVGDRDDATIPYFLGQELEAQVARLEGVDRIRVINAGQPWYNSTQELVFFVTELALYTPDLVVIMDGYNDAFHTAVWGNRPPSNQVTSEIISELLKSGRTYRDVTWQDGVRTFLNASSVRRRLGVETRHLWGTAGNASPVPPIKSSNPDERMELTMQHRLVMNWTLWERLSETLGFRVLFALQPAIYQKLAHSPEEVEWLSTDRFRERITDVWGELERFVGAETQRLGLTTFDADRYVAGSAETAFLDSCHLNGPGNHLVARAIGEAVVAELAAWPWSGRWDGVRYGLDRGDPIWRPAEPTVQSDWNR